MQKKHRLKNVISNIRKEYRLFTASRRPLPDFLIIGAQKAGTTSLFKYLGMHPSLQSSISTKELHFFDTYYARGENWYRANFPVSAPGKLCYEASPSYLMHPRVPQRAHAMLPKAKLLVLLRNPVERAYSSYQHQIRAGRETLSFEEAIAQEASRIGPELEKIMADPGFVAKDYRRFSYLERGKYVEQIKRWHEYYPKDAMLVIESESFWREPQEAFDRIFGFLGVESVSLPVKKKYNTGGYTSDMEPDTRQRLEEFYRPYNSALYEYLGENFNW